MASIAPIPSERQCRVLLENYVFGHEKRCRICQATFRKSHNYYWCKVCRKKYYLKSFTWLKGCKLTYQQIYLLVLGWQQNAPPGSLRTFVGLSYPTIARWYSRFRRHLPRDKTLLNGIVEVDEAFFGRQKYQNQKILMGAIERKSGKIKLAEIPDREQDSLEYFLWKKVHPESKLHTDAWTGYYDLWWNGYGHELHNHSRGEFRGTNRIENVWSVAKRQLRRMYGQIKTAKLEEFALEWEARRNFPHLFSTPKAYLLETLFALS